MRIASITTYFADLEAGDGDQDVQGGNPITVYGITVSASTSAVARVDFKTKTAVPNRPAGTVFSTISVVADGTHTDNVPFIADAGIVVDVLDGVPDVTVKHGHQGS